MVTNWPYWKAVQFSKLEKKYIDFPLVTLPKLSAKLDTGRCDVIVIKFLFTKFFASLLQMM